MFCQIRMPTTPMSALNRAYSMMSWPDSSRTNRRSACPMDRTRGKLRARPAGDSGDGGVVALIPAVHRPADVRDQSHADKRDETRQQRVLDQVLTFFAGYEPGHDAHISLLRREW